MTPLRTRAAALRAALILMLLAVALGGAIRVSPAVAQDTQPHDLAAAVLPVDAFELPANSDDFGLATGWNAPLEGFLAVELTSSAELVDDLTDAGWIASYTAEYWGGSDLELTYRLSVGQFADGDGAMDAFDTAGDYLDASETSLAGSDAAASAPATTGEATGVTVVFVIGDVLAMVTGLTEEPAPSIDEDDVATTAERYLERIEEVQDGEVPGISSRLLQMRMQNVGYGAYRRIDGDPILRWGVSEAYLEETLGEEARDVYAQRQTERLPDTPLDQSLYYDGYLFTFASDDDAEAFVEDAESIIAANPSVAEVRVLDDAPDVGERAVALSYESVVDEGRGIFVATSIVAQVDDMAFRVDLGIQWEGEGLPPVAVPVEAVEEIALQQVECLEEGCPEELAAIPDSLKDAVADAAEPDGDASQDDEEVADSTGADGGGDTVDGNVYTSPTYGYTVTWGTAFWEVVDESSSGGEDVLVLTNAFSLDTTARFTGTDAYDDAEECLEGAVDELLANPDFADFEQSGADGDQPFEGEGSIGPYTGYTDGETFVVLTCAELPSGEGVLLATLTTPLDSLVATYLDFDFLLQQIEL